MENKKNTFIIIGFFIFTIALVSAMILVIKKINDKKIEDPKPTNPIIEPTITEDISNFDYTMIHAVNEKYKSNYMISPLSIGYALDMAKEGAQADTYEQIKTLLDDYKYPKVSNITNKVAIANAMFINNKYKKNINQTYQETLTNKYNAEINFDDYKSPDNINNWIKEKTFGMIDKTLDKVDEKTVMSLINTVAIDVDWKHKFDATNTKEDKFTLIDGAIKKVAMMRDEDNFTYIRSNKAKGIIKDYAIYDKEGNKISEDEKDENSIELEYIAILPDDLNEYISTFDYKELYTLLSNKKIANDKTKLIARLPKYKYEFDYDQFKDSLIENGMTDAFDENANFKNISDLDLYISDAIHKSYIELNEEGTKAGAVTVLAFKDLAMAVEDQKEIIEINFDRPFLYLIKDKNSYNIWFFGVVYEPSEYNPADYTNY